MKRVLSILLIFCFGCKHKSKTTSFQVNKNCIVDSVVYYGQRSTIEPDIYWNVYTTCGKTFQTKQPYNYMRGDTIILQTFYETGGF